MAPTEMARRSTVWVDEDALERLMETNQALNDLAYQETALTLAQRSQMIGLTKDFIEHTQQALGLTKERS